MKHVSILFAAIVMMAALPVRAQEEKPAEPQGSWSTVTTPALKLSEFMFENWSKSGNSQIDLTATFFGNYKYTHTKYVWDNIADLAYGYAWQDLDNSSEGGLFETRRKSNDKIDLTSSISWKAYKDWGASFTANLKTQFGAGYEYTGIGDNEGKMVSSFFAPGLPHHGTLLRAQEARLVRLLLFPDRQDHLRLQQRPHRQRLHLRCHPGQGLQPRRPRPLLDPRLLRPR